MMKCVRDKENYYGNVLNFTKVGSNAARDCKIYASMLGECTVQEHIIGMALHERVKLVFRFWTSFELVLFELFCFNFFELFLFELFCLNFFWPSFIWPFLFELFCLNFLWTFFLHFFEFFFIWTFLFELFLFELFCELFCLIFFIWTFLLEL